MESGGTIEFDRRSGAERRDRSDRRLDEDRRDRNVGWVWFWNRREKNDRRAGADRRYGVDRRTRGELGILRPGEVWPGQT